MPSAGTGELRSKLDAGPPPWLPITQQAWVPLPIHSEYGGPLPLLPVVRIEENIAEKIARLNRRTFARDMYDLVWLAQKPTGPGPGAHQAPGSTEMLGRQERTLF